MQIGELCKLFISINLPTYFIFGYEFWSVIFLFLVKSKYKLYTITKSGLHYLPQNYLITYSWNLLSREAINLENEKERIYRNVAFVCTAYSCFISFSIQSLIYFAVKGIRRRVIFSFAFCNRFENISTYTNDPYIKHVKDIIYGQNAIQL